MADVISNVVLVNTANTLSATYDFEIDGSPEVPDYVVAQWFRNGAMVAQTLIGPPDPVEYTPAVSIGADSWYVRLQGNSSAFVQSNTVTGVNAAVSHPYKVEITPQFPTTLSQLTVSWKATSPESNSEIRWYENDVLVPAFNDLETITPVSPAVADSWKAEVRLQSANLSWSQFVVSPYVYIGDDWTITTEMDRGRVSQVDAIGGTSEYSRTATRLVMGQDMVGRMVAVDFSATSHTKLQGFGVEYLVRRGIKK